MNDLNFTQILIFLLVALTLTGCELAAGIFEAGIWVGIIIVVLAIFLIIWLIRKLLG